MNTTRAAAPHEATGTEPSPTVRSSGSQGEHLLQSAYDTAERAGRFYRDQVCNRLLPTMVEFVGRMEMMFVATADGHGECDATLRAGPAGFVQVLDEEHLAYPEYRGNGVLASLGNISENPHVGLLMVDFIRDLIGLHVNGRAQIIEDGDLRAAYPNLPPTDVPGRRAQLWVVVEIEEAYVHCRKHIPQLMPVPHNRAWGTDDVRRKGGNYFGATAEPEPWTESDIPRGRANREPGANLAGRRPVLGEPGAHSDARSPTAPSRRLK
jgi:predicted pyridoxine 5'-phosphate oxidase superfamily flavin-nucleotide-binding protein